MFQLGKLGSYMLYVTDTSLKKRPPSYTKILVSSNFNFNQDVITAQGRTVIKLLDLLLTEGMWDYTVLLGMNKKHYSEVIYTMRRYFYSYILWMKKDITVGIHTWLNLIRYFCLSWVKKDYIQMGLLRYCLQTHL